MPTIDLIKTAASQFQLDLTDECAALLASEVPPAIVAGSSGGKDSSVLVIRLNQFLNALHYQGERLIVHADLGRIEHVESIDHVRKLAAFVGWPLLIAKREKGDLLDRYEQRWHDNCTRYALLECVNLISPFPAPMSPFCRSEVKVAPIVQAVTKRFPGQIIISCVGLRAEESNARAKKPIFRLNDKFQRRNGSRGFDWHPIHNTTIEQVFLTHRKAGFPLHPQYLRGNERLSCSFCFLGSKNDLTHGAEVQTNHESYRIISALEIRSSFSYQQNAWLADLRPDLLSPDLRQQLRLTKIKATERRLAETGVPEECLFKNNGGRRGWPERQPTIAECELIAGARQEIDRLFGNEIFQTTGLRIRHLTAPEVYNRYNQLLTQRPPTNDLPLFHTPELPTLTQELAVIHANRNQAATITLQSATL